MAVQAANTSGTGLEHVSIIVDALKYEGRSLR